VSDPDFESTLATGDRSMTAGLVNWNEVRALEIKLRLPPLKFVRSLCNHDSVNRLLSLYFDWMIATIEHCNMDPKS
jgi:hypothetical protein